MKLACLKTFPAEFFRWALESGQQTAESLNYVRSIPILSSRSKATGGTASAAETDGKPRFSEHGRAASPRALLDFRPVFRNRAAMAWIAGYTFHAWEMAGLRAWGVTFLTLTAAQAGAPAWFPAPTILFTIAGFAGIAVSILGNEMSQHFGRTAASATTATITS
jgi:hypothetical protein